MGTFQKGILGGFSGKVGTVVGATGAARTLCGAFRKEATESLQNNKRL
jgi:hypothetical protein